MAEIRVLFLPDVEGDNTNAQSLNVREVALRLDPERIQSTLWYEKEPDPRLRNLPGICLLKLPEHGKTRRILREMLSGYDIIAYMDYSPASYLFLRIPRFARSRRAKAVFHAEAPAAQLSNPSSTLRFLYNGTYSSCDAYTGITAFVAEDVYKNTKRKVSHILPVGVDTKTFTPAEQQRSGQPVVVLFAGTLIERKGPQYVVDAALQFPDATFRLVGSGRGGFDVVLRQKIVQLGLKNISVDGPKTQSQLVEIMRQCDIFLLPSRLEGIPKVTLEAAATGLPCIVFRDYETPSVIDGVTGFQVRTIDEMTSALKNLISDASLRLRMGAAARQHIANFDWDVVSKQWQSAYLEMAADVLR
jgi:glycosyltransferase involved in cell wall biosynthesis